MALKLNERYPGRFNNPSADYPQGSFKNRSSPTAKDGSYLEQDWANDKEGFFQSLIAAAVITANGNVDKVGASQYYDALQQVVRNTSIGRLLRTTTYINVGGALQGSRDGAPFSLFNSTFFPLTDTKAVDVEIQGGGAQGGGAPATGAGQVSCGCGGGGGGYSRKWMTSGFSGLLVTVGAGGSTGGVGASGQAGGSSSFGPSLTATGGNSGVAFAAVTANTQPTGGAAGGIGSGGDITASGGVGFNGTYSTAPIGGTGGGSMFGAGAPLVSGTFAGNPSVSYGAGGGGAALGPGNGAVKGGAGKSGIIIVREYA